MTVPASRRESKPSGLYESDFASENLPCYSIYPNPLFPHRRRQFGNHMPGVPAAPAAPAAAHTLSVAMERTGQWVFSQEIPSDIVIKVDDATFPLHKFILLAKSGYIRRKIMESDRSDLAIMELNGIPGGAEAFDKAARFCYGVNFEISVQNVAALRCAAEWLDMTEKSCEGNLAARADEFLAKAALSTLPGAVVVLNSCEGILALAEKLRIVQRCVEAIGNKAVHEASFPNRSPPDWWAAELALLKPPFFQKCLAAVKARGAAPKTISTAVIVYAGKSLPELLLCAGGGSRPSPSPPADSTTHRRFIEFLISMLPADRDAPLPVGFLCNLLRAAIFLNSSAASRTDLERRISAFLDQAAISDLMTLSFDYSGQRLTDLDSIRRIVTGFAGLEIVGAATQRVARTVDAFLAEIATEEDLPVSMFAGIAGALPKSARRFDDDLYRAVDIYLKAHSKLDEIEREKACSVMDPFRLSYDARLHASQNKRLPLQVVLPALYYDQLKLRGGDTPDESSLSAVSSGRGRGDDALAKENESLRLELARMKVYMTDMQRSQGGRGKAPMAALPPPQTSGKKPTFFSSVSKTLVKLNPFRHGSKDTASIEESVGVDVAKPKKRRFSLS